MRDVTTYRGLLTRVLMLGVMASVCAGARAQRRLGPVYRGRASYTMVYAGQGRGFRGQQQRPAPIERRPPPPGGAMVGPLGPQHQLVGPNGRRGGEHLAEWMNQHSGMTLQQQQMALDREPGFRELPPQTQLRMHQRLAQLNAMTPLQRQRLLEHTEAMERLNPMQRGEVRGAMQELGSLPLAQRQQVVRCFRELRMLPPEQRMGALASPQYGWLNYEQRTTLTNLIQIAPMLPPQ